MNLFTESDVMIGDMGEASFSEYNLTMYFYNHYSLLYLILIIS